MSLIVISASVIKVWILVVEKRLDACLVVIVQARITGTDIREGLLERVVSLQEEAL